MEQIRVCACGSKTSHYLETKMFAYHHGCLLTYSFSRIQSPVVVPLNTNKKKNIGLFLFTISY